MSCSVSPARRAPDAGRLKVYLGMAAGVGKTVRMLDDAHAARHAGVDIIVGFVEPHGRAETAARVRDLEVIPRKRVTYRDVVIEEMDLEAILARRADVVVVDELPHTNAPGSRNEKRWQDVEEILATGTSVMTALNVQHLEGVQDIVQSATGIDARALTSHRAGPGLGHAAPDAGRDGPARRGGGVPQARAAHRRMGHLFRVAGRARRRGDGSGGGGAGERAGPGGARSSGSASWRRSST